MTSNGYKQKFLIEGNDSRGIDVAVMAREKTRDGQEIEFQRIKSHAALTYDDLELHTPQLEEVGAEKHEKIFRRDCLEIDFKIDGRPVNVSHFKSMGTHKRNVVGRDYTMPVRMAEAGAVRKLIERRFGKEKAAKKRWFVCGDFNDYQSRLVISGTRQSGFTFDHVKEKTSGVNPLLTDGFCINLMERRQLQDQWTLYYSRGPLIIFWCLPCWRETIIKLCRKSFAVDSHGGQYFRPVRKWNVIHAPVGTGPKPAITARWSCLLTNCNGYIEFGSTSAIHGISTISARRKISTIQNGVTEDGCGRNIADHPLNYKHV